MKKIKKLSALVLVLILCLSLCGCDELDRMRELHAVWAEKGSTDKLILGDETYYKLDNLGDADPMYSTDINIYSISVTDPDVPVLLSEMFGTYLNITDDKNFIEGYIYYNEYLGSKTGYTGEGSDVLYCTEELYEKYSNIDVNKLEYTGYGYGYWDVNKETKMDEYKYYYFTDKENDIINHIVKTVKPIEESPAVHDETKEYFITLDKITSDRCLATYSYDIGKDNNDVYYLEMFSDSTLNYICYKVPSKYNTMFDEIEKNLDAFDLYYQ